MALDPIVVAGGIFKFFVLPQVIFLFLITYLINQDSEALNTFNSQAGSIQPFLPQN